MPVVVLATGNRAFSGVLKLRLNTSSCIAGPFSTGRMVTHIGTILHQDNGRGTRMTRIGCSGLGVGLAGCRLVMSNGTVSAPPGRLRLVCRLTDGPGHMCAHSRLLSRI